MEQVGREQQRINMNRYSRRKTNAASPARAAVAPPLRRSGGWPRGGLVRLAASAALLLTGCNLTNDVNVPLPKFESQLVVECYLEDGQVPRLTVTESVPYLGNSGVAPAGSVDVALPNGQRVQLPTDVQVTLTLPDGQAVPLAFQPGLALADGRTLALQQPSGARLDSLPVKIFTHAGQSPIAARPGDKFGLEVQDGRGRRVTGTAVMPAFVPLDSVSYKYNTPDSPTREAYVLANFFDPGATQDFYRLQINHSRLTRRAAIDYDAEDRLNNGKTFVLGTSYRFHPSDTLLITLYHLDEPFYSFRSSVRDARNANGNPFSQPSAIRSTVQGGLGVFTVLSYDRKMLVLP